MLNTIGSTNSTLNDVAKIQFSFLATGDSVEFDYIFASNEYSGYTCTNFNDVFGFFLIGPGINGAPLFNPNGSVRMDSINLATIPGTNTPVAINTINGGAPTGSGTIANCLAANPNFVAHSVYFNANSSLGTINFNGFTDVFKAKAGVVCGYPYTIKLLIADVMDGSFNSAVFLGARSFKVPTISLSPTTNTGVSFTDSVMVEGCARSYLLFQRQGATSDTLTAQFQYVGTAGTADFASSLPSSLTLLPGQTTDTLWFEPVDDGLVEAPELLRIRMLPVATDCAVYPADSVDIWLRDKIPHQGFLSVVQGNDTLSCPGSTATLGSLLTGGEGVRWGYWEHDTT
ncbi:MAG: choice-of-anchor L domain-containing protein, partial [Schleiferiaceae bacterium]